jgi:hypothetical protein
MVPTRLLIRACRFLFAAALVLATYMSTVAQAPTQQNASRKISGFGVIDCVITTGAEPVFRADGYALRLNSGTSVRFSGSLTSLSEVGTNIWVHYEGTRNQQGEIVLNAAEFIKPKLHKPKRNPKISVAQVTAFPRGSMIDFDGSFQTDSYAHVPEDSGGPCGSGWYPVPEDAALQERVRRIGASVVPQYQRDLPDDDPAKIPFRFYAIQEEHIRSGMGCDDGLVLVPASAVARMQNDSQLAAVLADGVVVNLQQQNVRLQLELRLMDAAAGAALSSAEAWGLAGFTGEKIAKLSVLRKMEEQRGRLSLAYMADAGFDPWQAPEAWRLLAPAKLPKNLSKLKNPERSKYQSEILQLQYKPAINSANSLAPEPPASAQ